MRVGPRPGLILAAVSLLMLGGCETTSEHTGSVAGMKDDTPSSTGLMGEDPKGDLEMGKKHYRENSFGLAEQHFRKAVEKGPKDLEAWVGLAASYDKLRRFDLADRAYAQAIRLAGPTPEILNNQGYSYLLRGDRQRARRTLLAAQAKDPSNPYIQNNLNLLDESLREGAAVR
ncbi:tetratricopeptide repeat protein [Pseudorhodoplanes sp.]|uniref:tetratricopeptide repeat protein n=1 Tax=Pseudorhodoplanes sp. TaxID=1934341 RepID=UPI002BA852B6|nr:tetratricopeptide repeat protein [Pseudorhodoplanes sp.]HWV53004.1 tetratricopeptide repeat protein [Pseudorhodoplanes sp.]